MIRNVIKSKLPYMTIVAVAVILGTVLKNNPRVESTNNNNTTVAMISPAVVVKQIKENVRVINVTDLSVDKDKIVMFEDEVNTVTIDRALSSLKSVLRNNDSAYLFIDSPGGSVFDGAKLLTFIEGSKKPIYTVCISLCASMGFHIFEAGKKRYMTTNAVLMTHPAAGGLQGTIPEMKALLDMIERYTAAMEAKIAKRAGLTKEAFELMNLRNSWLMADQAVETRLADTVVNLDIKENLF